MAGLGMGSGVKCDWFDKGGGRGANPYTIEMRNKVMLIKEEHYLSAKMPIEVYYILSTSKLHPNYEKLHPDYEKGHPFYEKVHPNYEQTTSQLRGKYIPTTRKEVRKNKKMLNFF